MSLFTIPVSLGRCLENIMRDFLWPNNESAKGIHWVNWGEVLPSQATRPGIEPLRVMNDALKIKWIWRFVKAEDALWRKVIASKLGA